MTDPATHTSADARARLIELLTLELGDTYDCTRVWEAWSVGTMGEDDFEPVIDRVEGIADAILALTAEIAEGATGAGNARAGERIPYDVARLVVAARLVVESDPRDENGAAASGLTELNDAAEVFASRVCWDDGGGDIPEAHANPCTCALAPATPVGAIAEGRES